jgi:hypothetical protein
MKTFKVYSSQIVYHVAEVEAEDAEQAGELAYKQDLNWRWFDCAEWQIDEVEEITE